MFNILCIDPAKLDKHLKLLKLLLRPRFPERPPPEGRGGRPRKWERWVIIALALIGGSLPLSWSNYTQELKGCENIIKKWGATGLPGKTSLFNAWKEISELQLINQITLLGRKICPQPQSVAMDSTGFILKGGTIWRILKWSKSLLKKTSRLFWKVHLIVETRKQAILSIALSPSKTHDVKRSGALLHRLGKRLLTHVKWVYADKAYQDDKLFNYFEQESIKLVVEPKRNAVDHGTTSFRDRSLRFFCQAKGLWKYTYRIGRKASVEHVIGLVKLHTQPMRARKPCSRRKSLLLQFLVYNFSLYLKTLYSPS